MAREEAKTTITDDYGEPHGYYCIQHKGRRGWRMLAKLLGILGGATGRSFGALSPAQIPMAVKELSGFLDSGIDGEGLATALEKLSDRLLDEEAFLLDILSSTWRDGESVADTFDEAFMGNYGEMMLCIKWTLEHNFGPSLRRALGPLSLGKLSKLKAVLQAAMSSESSPDQPSTPGSGSPQSLEAGTQS